MDEEITTTGQALAIDFEVELNEPRLLAFVFAEWGETTKTGKAALGGIFDRLFFEPENPVGFCIYVRLAQIATGVAKIIMIAPDGSIVGELILEKSDDNTVPGSNPIYMHAVTRLLLPIKQVGLYWFDVVYEGKRLGLVPLQMSVLEEPPNGATAV